MSYLISNQRDVESQLQYVFENSRTTPANFGVTPNSATFIQAGYNPRFRIVDQPEGVEVRILGNEGRTEKVKVAHSALLELRTNVVDVNLIKYCFNPAGGGASTIDDSTTFLTKYKVLGNSTFRVLKGCMPLSATLEISNRGLIELRAQFISCNPEKESGSHGLAGSPTFAPALTGPAWTHLSGGAAPFVYNTRTYRERGLSISITHEFSMLDSSGDTEILFMRAARKVCTGQVTTFKIDRLLSAATQDYDEKTATRVIKSGAGASTLTISGMQFQEHPTEFDQESSESQLEVLPFEATSFSFS